MRFASSAHHAVVVIDPRESPMSIKVGVFVDSENVRANGGYHLRYDILRRYAERGERSLLRLNCYMALDMQRAEKDSDYARKCYHQQQIARQFGWKVNVKEMQQGGGDNNRSHNAEGNEGGMTPQQRVRGEAALGARKLFPGAGTLRLVYYL